MGKLTKLFSPKAIRLFFVASLLGLMTMGGLLRYSARASEEVSEGVLGGALPTLSAAKSLLFGEITADELYKFSMEQVGRQSGYVVFNVSVVEQGGEAKAFLQVQKTHHDGAVKQYEKNLDAESFAKFWQALRELEVAQLSDLSPYSENLNQLSRGSLSSAAIPKVPHSATYRFQFQDGVYDYPNSFEVYAPDLLKDLRYQKLRDLTNSFVQETFSEVLVE
jgi:hypothetical protein